jgi:hypothetical protein
MVSSEKNRLLSLLAVVPPVLLVALLVLLDTADDQAQAPDWLQHLADHRYPYLLAVGLASTVGPLATFLYATQARRRSLTYFLTHMHLRFWNKRGERDSEYRVSLFVPTLLGGRLRCYFRSDGRRTRQQWSQRQPGDGRSADGVVGAVWLTGMTIEVGSPPERPTEEELAEYRMRCHITKPVQGRRSWPYAAILGIPVQSSDDGRPIAVLLVERNRPDARIGRVSARDYQHDVQVCTMLLQGRL